MDPRVEDITKDFLERDGKTFVRKRTTGRVGWEESLEKGAALSSYFMKDPEPGELMRKAYSIAGDMLKAMDTPFKVKVCIEPYGSRSATDSRNVWVATDHFDNDALTPGQKVDIFTGYAIHEGCHLLYTNFHAGTSHPEKLIKKLAYIIEDERIEMLIGEERPGLAGYLEQVKTYLFGKAEEKRPEEETPLSRVLSCIFGLIRFPAMLNEDDVIEYYEHLKKVRDILTPFPQSTEESFTAAEKILDVIKDIYKEELERRKREEALKKMLAKAAKELGDKGGKDDSKEKEDTSEPDRDGTGDEDPFFDKSELEDGDGDPDDDAPEGDGEDGDDGKSAGKWMKPGEEPSDEDGDGHADTDDSGTGEIDTEPIPGPVHAEGPDGDDGTEAPEVSDEEVSDEIKDDLDRISDYLDSLETKDPTKGLDDDSVADRLKKDGYLEAEEIEGLVEKGAGKAFFTKPAADEARYRSSLARIGGFVAPIKKALKYHCFESDLSLRGMQSGTLDTAKLVEASLGENTVYMQERRIKCNRRAVCVLIDESGSMSGMRETAARDTAILLNEAIGGLPSVDLFIYGHTADVRTLHGTDLHIYREKGYSPAFVLGSSEADNQNRDGDAIREVALRVRKQTREHVLMFVISDGAPCADRYSGRSAIEHTRKAVQDVTKMGFTPVQICINASYDPKTMFDNFIILDDMGTLAKDLSKVIKDSLAKDIKKTIV